MWVRVALRYKPRPHPRSSRTSNFRSECLNAGFPPFFFAIFQKLRLLLASFLTAIPYMTKATAIGTQSLSTTASNAARCAVLQRRL